MRDPASVFGMRDNVVEALGHILNALSEIRPSCVLAREPCSGMSYRQREGFRTNATLLALLWDARTEIEIASRYRSQLAKHRRADASLALKVYRFLYEELIRSDYVFARYRPRLLVKADIALSRRTAALLNIRQARAALEEPLPQGVYFYADLIPFSDLANGTEPPHQLFGELVLTLKTAIIGHDGWLEELEGTDNIRGFIPRVDVAYRFLTAEIRQLTHNFATARGCKNSIGWSVGAGYGAAHMLFGRLQAGERDAVVAAARLMEKADGCARADYAIRASLGLKDTTSSGHLSFFAKEFISELTNRDALPVTLHRRNGEDYWYWNEIAP